MAPYRAVVFDLDGTLTDSAPGITAAVRHALVRLGEPVPDERTLRRHIGPPLEWGFREIEGMDAATATRARDEFRGYYRERGWAENALYPGTADLLAELAGAGVRAVVATAKLEELARRITAHFDLDRYLLGVCGAGADERSADKAEIVARALALLGGERPDGAGRDGAGPAVVVGDREHDFKAAAAHGLDSIAVTWGYGEESEWRLATRRVESVTELRTLLLG